MTFNRSTHYAATWLLHPQAPAVTPPQNILDRYEHYRCECQQGGRQS